MLNVTGDRLVKATDDDSNVDLKLYQGIIGSIMYAMLCTRVDLAFAIQQLSQFNSKPTNAHLQAAKRALRYLQRTQNVGLKYNAKIENRYRATYSCLQDQQSAGKQRSKQLLLCQPLNPSIMLLRKQSKKQFGSKTFSRT